MHDTFFKVLEMGVGDKRTVLVPWQLGYGKRGSPPDIGPMAALRFEIKIKAIA